MEAPELPDNEAARIETLHRLNVLDTPRHDRFDRYTRISARIFDVPVAMISLIDRYRQWFKSVEGFDAEETSREDSFCGHAILGDDVFEISNARRDRRFRDNPLVLEQPHICFYAGAPLKAPNGHKLGTLCLIDRVPRRLSDEEKVMLKNLADMVVAEMVNYVDTETGLDKRNSLLASGTKCFEEAKDGRGFSLLLFDLTEIVMAGSDENSAAPAGEQFAGLLRRHFPNAESMASLGREDFCVLLKDKRSFDGEAAIKALCEEAKDTIYPDTRFDTFSALVGRIDYDPDRHAKFIDMLHEADELFFLRDTKPSTEIAEKVRSREMLVRWRKTIF